MGTPISFNPPGGVIVPGGRMAGGFCEHGKIWTTCGICGKEVITRSRQSKRKSGPADDELIFDATLAREANGLKRPPPEPPRTEYEGEQ